MFLYNIVEIIIELKDRWKQNSHKELKMYLLSREEAIRLGNEYIGLEHLFLGMIREGEGLAIRILNYFCMDLSEFRKTIESHCEPTRNRSAIMIIFPWSNRRNGH